MKHKRSGTSVPVMWRRRSILVDTELRPLGQAARFPLLCDHPFVSDGRSLSCSANKKLESVACLPLTTCGCRQHMIGRMDHNEREERVFETLLVIPAVKCFDWCSNKSNYCYHCDRSLNPTSAVSGAHHSQMADPRGNCFPPSTDLVPLFASALPAYFAPNYSPRYFV